MKTQNLFLKSLLAATILCSLSTLSLGQIDPPQANPAASAGTVIVQTKFGGGIVGFDIDQNGTEGLLSEAGTLPNGDTLAAVETFDQSTGEIVKVVKKITTKFNDFITRGVVGNSVGLVEYEQSRGARKPVQRTFDVLNPLSTNKFTGTWTPTLGTGFVIEEVSRNQGTSNNAFFVTGLDNPLVFGSNVAANTFGPQIPLTNPAFQGAFPPIAYDPATNQAILGSAGIARGAFPTIGLVNLTTGDTTVFTGVGDGGVNGIAVDSADAIACTTTEIDAKVEFYDLNTLTGFTVTLPESGNNQINSGADVEFDPINKLFLVAQPVSSTAPSGSSIQVYDVKGKLIESINGFNFSNASSIIPAYIALKPSDRTGFVDGPDGGQIQGFTY